MYFTKSTGPYPLPLFHDPALREMRRLDECCRRCKRRAWLLQRSMSETHVLQSQVKFSRDGLERVLIWYFQPPRCFRTCHTGECGSEKECKKKVKLFCPCKRLKIDAPCSSSKSVKVDCGELCEEAKAQVRIECCRRSFQNSNYLYPIYAGSESSRTRG